MRKELQAELPCYRYPMPTLSIKKENKTMTDYPNNIPAKLLILAPMSSYIGTVGKNSANDLFLNYFGFVHHLLVMIIRMMEVMF